MENNTSSVGYVSKDRSQQNDKEIIPELTTE